MERNLYFLLLSLVKILPHKRLDNLPLGRLSTGIIIFNNTKIESGMELIPQSAYYEKDPFLNPSTMYGRISTCKIIVFDGLQVGRVTNYPRSSFPVVGDDYLELNEFLYSIIDTCTSQIKLQKNA